MYDGKQILNKFLFWRERVAVDDEQFGPVPFTKGREPLEAETDQPIFVGRDEPPYLTQLNQFHDAIELLASVV